MADEPRRVDPESGGISGVMRRAAEHKPDGELDHRQLRAGVRAGLFGTPQEELRVGRFKLIQKLGSGGMGTVYAALDTVAGRRVALKVLESDDRELRSRIQREAKALARLDHPNVVSVYEVGPYEDGIYLAMELVEGQTLRHWLETQRSAEEVLAVLLQVADALAAAHAIGIVHRDVKPENVMIDDDGHVSLLDFGLVKAQKRQSIERAISGISSHVTRPGTRLGTVGYMAPEQILGEPVDARADVFALCVVLYEALYGHGPFAGDTPEAVTLAVLNGRHERPPDDPRVPEHVRDAVVAGIQLEPDARPASIEALVRALTDPSAAALVVPVRPEAGGAEPVGLLAALAGLFRALMDRLLRG